MEKGGLGNDNLWVLGDFVLSADEKPRFKRGAASTVRFPPPPPVRIASNTSTSASLEDALDVYAAAGVQE